MKPAGPLTRLAAFVAVGLNLSAGLWLLFRPSVALEFLQATKPPHPIVTPLVAVLVLMVGLAGWYVVTRAPKVSHLVGVGYVVAVGLLGVVWFVTEERVYGLADLLVAFGAVLVWVGRRLDARGAT
ncbi:MAG: hypothetical protein SFW67_34845 [Myxococcaceae bacterium]|nr:hypothetical protein [Myxococcaceae bacterium]